MCWCKPRPLSRTLWRDSAVHPLWSWQVKRIDEMKPAISCHLKTGSICPLIYGVLRDHLLYKLGYYNEVKLLQKQVKEQIWKLDSYSMSCVPF